MSAFEVHVTADGFVLSLRGGELICHSARRPALYLGRGDEKIRMYRGNFEISDRVSERVALRFARAEGSCLVFTHPDLAGELRLTIEERAGLLSGAVRGGSGRLPRGLLFGLLSRSVRGIMCRL